jgi:hypothetical protein
VLEYDIEVVALSFASLMQDLQRNIELNKDSLAKILRKSPNLAYQKINELARFTGSRYSVDLQLHFPIAGKISDVESYGTENIGIVVDKFRKNFPVTREEVKKKAIEFLGIEAKPQDAYMYEGKEGVKVIMHTGRIEILPGSVHFWCRIDDKVSAYADWLMENIYFSKEKA